MKHAIWLVNIGQDETILHGKFKYAFRWVFKMSDNRNISMREINNNILNERQVHQNSEQRFTITTESELTWPLFHCSYFIKLNLYNYRTVFSCRIAWSMHLGCFSTFGKRKNTLACGSSIFTLSESLATSLVHGSRNPARKTIRYSFSILLYQHSTVSTVHYNTLLYQYSRIQYSSKHYCTSTVQYNTIQYITVPVQ